MAHAMQRFELQERDLASSLDTFGTLLLHLSVGCDGSAVAVPQLSTQS